MNEPAYKGFGQDEMEYQYNPRVSVPEYPELAKMRAAQARKVRDRDETVNTSRGRHARELLDIYAADKPAGPVLVYIHGGYWRSGSKEDNCNFVPTFTQRGATVVLVEYDLCPQVTVSDIVRQTRSAIAWTYKNIVRYGADPAKLFIAGHSAGGHLTAMALVQENVRMTPEIAAANSPLIHPPRVMCPLLVAVGGAEPKGWQQMSEDYFQFAKQHGMNATYLVEPDANHYTMSEHLLDDRRPLTQAMIRQLGLG